MEFQPVTIASRKEGGAYFSSLAVLKTQRFSTVRSSVGIWKTALVAKYSHTRLSLPMLAMLSFPVLFLLFNYTMFLAKLS